MNLQLVCWRCGAPLERDLPMPLARLAECTACRTELHVCRMCRYYDTTVAKSCREPVADEVANKVRANFCGYFDPRPDAYVPGDGAPVEAARAALDALFGGGPANDRAEPDAGVRELNDLFGPRKPDDGGR